MVSAEILGLKSRVKPEHELFFQKICYFCLGHLPSLGLLICFSNVPVVTDMRDRNRIETLGRTSCSTCGMEEASCTDK